jgi:hypothetical protein
VFKHQKLNRKRLACQKIAEGWKSVAKIFIVRPRFDMDIFSELYAVMSFQFDGTVSRPFRPPRDFQAALL